MVGFEWMDSGTLTLSDILCEGSSEHWKPDFGRPWIFQRIRTIRYCFREMLVRFARCRVPKWVGGLESAPVGLEIHRFVWKPVGKFGNGHIRSEMFRGVRRSADLCGNVSGSLGMHEFVRTSVWKFGNAPICTGMFCGGGRSADLCGNAPICADKCLEVWECAD
jgi:hypothetical protein